MKTTTEILLAARQFVITIVNEADPTIGKAAMITRLERWEKAGIALLADGLGAVLPDGPAEQPSTLAEIKEASERVQEIRRELDAKLAALDRAILRARTRREPFGFPNGNLVLEIIQLEARLSELSW